MNKQEVANFVKKINRRFEKHPNSDRVFLAIEEWNTLKAIIKDHQESIRSITIMMEQHMKAHKREENFWAKMKSEIT